MSTCQRCAGRYFFAHYLADYTTQLNNSVAAITVDAPPIESVPFAVLSVSVTGLAKLIAGLLDGRHDAAVIAPPLDPPPELGLELVAERDITANVIEALHRDTPRRRAGGRRIVSGPAAAQQTRLNPQEKRITDEAIHADLQGYEATQGRIWLTRDGQMQDHILEAGQRLAFTGPARLRVSAEGGGAQLRWARVRA